MARARNLKPGFFLNDKLAECDPLARLLFAGLWCVADREGRLKDRPKKIKAEILPYDVCCVETFLEDLRLRGFIMRYEAEEDRYIQITNFSKHQNPHIKEAPSTIPPPPENERAPCKHQKSTMQAPEKHSTSPADSLSLDSLNRIPDSGFPQSPNPVQTPGTDGICTEQSKPQHGESLTVTQHGESQTNSKMAEPATGTEAREQPSTTLAAKRFEEFWSAYPRKVGKKAAEVTWKKIRPDSELHDRIIAAVNSAKKTDQWQREGGRFIPNPATWLNQGRWDDEYGEEVRSGETRRDTAQGDSRDLAGRFRQFVQS